MPAYCERDHIGEVIRTAPPIVDLIVVVDDASPDDTGAVALATGDPRLRLVTLPRNVGAGGAVKIGHQVALAAGADICVVMDGDGQMDPGCLPALVEPVLDGRAGYAKGNRFYSRSSHRGMPIVRLVGNVVITWMMHLATSQWHVRDPLNGYTAIRADVLRQVALDRTGNGFTFLLDLLGQLQVAGVPVVDVPMPARYGAETSSLRLSAVATQILGAPLVVAARRFGLTQRSLRRVESAVLTCVALVAAAGAAVLIPDSDPAPALVAGGLVASVAGLGVAMTARAVRRQFVAACEPVALPQELAEALSRPRGSAADA